MKRYLTIFVTFAVTMLMGLMVVWAWGCGWGTETAGQIMVTFGVTALIGAGVVAAATGGRYE